MAPASVSGDPASENIRVRKPVVEKMRRDRINGSIKHLRALLEKEFHQHHPNSKLEKADILEMAVAYLSQQHRCHADSVAFSQNNLLQEYHEGYNQCLQETHQFLSSCMQDKARYPKLMERFQRAETTVAHGPATASTAPPTTAVANNSTSHTPKEVWRPW